MTNFKLALAASAATLGLAAGAHAQTAEVAELVVPGRLEESLPTEIARYGNRLEVIGAEDIQNAGFADVGQALERMMPGLSLTPQSGGFSYNTASLQGSRPGEVLYLIDGVRISNRLYNTTPPLDTVPAYLVDRIEMLDGPQGLFFGTQAVAGVINTTSRPFTEQLTGRLQVSGDTNERRSLNGYASGSVGMHRFVVWAGRDAAEGFQPFPDSETEPSASDRNRGYRLTSAGLKYAIDFGDDVRLSASYQHIDGYVDFARPVDVVRAVNRRDEEIAWGKLDWRISDRTQLFIKTYWHDWDSHYDEDDNGPSGVETVSDNEFWGFWDYGLNAVVEYTVRPGFQAYLGYDLQNYWGKDDVLIIADKTETTHAIFGQLRFGPELLANTHLALGLRHNMPSEGEAATVWSLSGQYDVSDSLFVRGSAGTAFRLPDAESLFANDPIFNEEVGNPDLKPERSKNLNASVGAVTGGLTWELIGFWRETKDLIALDGETPDPDVFTFINTPGKVTAKGFEAVVQGEITPDWTLVASYTHAQTRMDGSSLQLAGVPEDYAQAALTWQPAGGPFGGSLIANWVGEVADNVSSGFGRQERGNYAVVDLGAWVDFGPGDRHRLSARIENALDEDYVTRVNRSFRDATGDAFLLHYRGVPRTLHVTYAYSF